MAYLDYAIWQKINRACFRPLPLIVLAALFDCKDPGRDGLFFSEWHRFYREYGKNESENSEVRETNQSAHLYC